MKTSAKYFGLAVGPRPGYMIQHGPKTTSLMTSLIKNLQPSTKNFLFKCRLDDCLIHLRVWTVL